MSRTILITGASAGFGAAMARRFVADGHRVIGAARRADKLDALAGDLGGAFRGFPLDVTDARATAALPGSLPDGWREVDVLVNNAGLALGLDPAFKAKLDDWDRMMQVNVVALAHLTHALLPGMVARNTGHIVNLGSTAGEYPYPGGHIYGASKAFVRQFSLALRSDLAGTGVRVTDLEPGLVGGSEFSLVRFGGDAEKAKAIYQGVHPLTPEDIAEAASWVVSLPAHVNINRLEMMPTAQAPGPLIVKRDG